METRSESSQELGLGPGVGLPAAHGTGGLDRFQTCGAATTQHRAMKRHVFRTKDMARGQVRKGSRSHLPPPTHTHRF